MRSFSTSWIRSLDNVHKPPEPRHTTFVREVIFLKNQNNNQNQHSNQNNQNQQNQNQNQQNKKSQNQCK